MGAETLAALLYGSLLLVGVSVGFGYLLGVLTGPRLEEGMQARTRKIKARRST